MITQTLDLNLIPGRVLPLVNVSQYDKDSRTLEFTIYNGDASFDLTGLSAYIQGLKPDGHGFNYSATVSSGKITADVTEQMTAVSGRVMCEVIIMSGTDRIGTGNFILNVEAAAMPDGSNMSDSDYSYIEQLIEDVQEAVTDAEAWAVGERGGVPVDPSDPTYENSAHYWALQASGAGNDMTGATASTPGAHGLVPAPSAGDQDKYLKGDGTWATVSGGGGSGSVFTFSDPNGDHTGETITATSGSTTVTGTISGATTTLIFPKTGTITITVGLNYTKIITLPYFKDVFFNLGEVNYGFKVAKSTSNPATRVEYIGDCVGFTPAYMDFGQDSFNYGDWQSAFFMPRPCMLKSDGTVDYYLDPTDYSKKMDGTASDIANTSYDGNVMLEFPKIWVKRTEDANYYYTYIADNQKDSDYKCYANMDATGAEIDHFYVAAYDGCVVSSKLRSLSGQTPGNTIAGSTFITNALANNPSSDYARGGWYISQWCDRALINDLLILIGKSTNVKETFGFGHYEGGTSASSLKQTGTLNDKGLFYGKNVSGYAVKVFGIENYWGNMWKFCAGLMANGTSVYAKMTWNTADGSSGTGYGTTAVSTSKSIGKTLGGTSGGYTSVTYNSQYGNIPITASGSSDTYECDGLWFNATANVYFALVGGGCSSGLRVGAFAVLLDLAVSDSYWNCGAALSCKPLAT